MSAEDFLAGITPLITSQQALGRPFVLGEDEHGPYLACRLGNRNPSKMYGWYIFVSPEDRDLVKDIIWGGYLTNKTITVRRYEFCNGKRYCIFLNRVVWENLHGSIPKNQCVYHTGHPLDFRRQFLSLSHPLTHKEGCRGVTWNNTFSCWTVRIYVRGKGSQHLGTPPTAEEGYRLYNRYLRQLKADNPKDAYIKAMPYNEVTPMF